MKPQGWNLIIEAEILASMPRFRPQLKGVAGEKYEGKRGEKLPRYMENVIA